MPRVTAMRAKVGEPELAIEISLPVPPEAAIEKVTAALKGQGFGVLTRIDAHVTFREKLGVSFRPFTILGACNPELAHRALTQEAKVGLLLPCNVTVESSPAGGSVIRIANPEAMAEMGGFDRDPVIQELMEEALQRLRRVAEATAKV